MPGPQRYSIRKLRPSIQPNCCNPCSNDVKRTRTPGSSATTDRSTPTRRIRFGCRARAASGHPRRAAEQRDELAPFQMSNPGIGTARL